MSHSPVSWMIAAAIALTIVVIVYFAFSKPAVNGHKYLFLGVWTFLAFVAIAVVLGL